MSSSEERQTFVMEADGSVVVGLEFDDRFEDLGKLGEGGMGEVHRVRDRRLDRVVAMKRLRATLDDRFVQRFFAEARATARLQHPGIVPVHELGVLPDGRPWFTMKEVHGETLGALLQTEAPLRRRLEWLLRVCEAVAYAHDKGVIHRDLKPDNVMVGAFGEVVVLDWGLAHAAGASGGRAGTPLYMAPEQFAGGALDARTDVYALGVILHEILVGEVPHPATGPVPEGPPELVALCLQALDADAANRPADAGVVAAALVEWLEGEQRRQRGLALHASAQELAPQVEAMRAEAAALRERAEVALEELASWQPEADKRAAWALEDRAVALEQQAELVKLEVEGRLHASLTQDPDLMASREALAALYRAEHVAALAARDATEIIRARERLRVQALALPEGNAVREDALAWLGGEARLDLATRRPVTARLFRFEEAHRRLVPRLVQDLGTTPVVDLRLPHGSYLVELDGAHGTVRYPVRLPRAGSWRAEGVRVDVEVGPDECLVPAGPFLSGGDPGSSEALDASEPWLDDLVFKRFNVTNAEYIAFLDDLVARGREEEALRHAPRERATAAGEGALIYGREGGRFVLRADEDGDVWLPDMPVFMVDWHGAVAYAAWLAETTGLPWRLPTELEWEKAARGVDGRFFPWGDFADPAWCNVRNSHREGPRPCPVDSFPVDVSVYGIRGMAGNVKDWCADPYEPRGGAASDGYRVYKGGNWSGTVRGVRCAFRDGNKESVRVHYIGFRVVRSVPPGA